RIDPASDEGQMAQTIYYAAGVLTIPVPAVYAKPDDDSGINFMHTSPPGLFLGAAALAGGPPQPLAFLAGSKLAYFRPGHYVREIVQTGTGLRAWLFAAIRTVNRDFPVARELEDTVKTYGAAIQQQLNAQNKELLTSLVSRMLANTGALDLK